VRIGRTDSFKKVWRRLTKEQRALAQKAIEKLVIDNATQPLESKRSKEPNTSGKLE
jgi:mRNA-degrading endonuclease RelE of RelBE toxin-antitoxin system